MTGSLPGPARLVDAIFVAALSAIGLFPLASSFAGIGWMVLGAIAVLTGIALAERAKAWRWPGSVLVLVVFAAFTVLAAPAPSVTRELGEMLPTPRGLAIVFRNSIQCWGDLIGTLPRVDSTGAVMLVPLILGLFAASMAMGLAMMTRSAGLPLVPLAMMLAASLALGRDETTWQVTTGIGFATLALWWVTLRGRRGSGATRPRRGRQAVAGLVMLALAATAAPLLTNRIAGDRDRLILRETVARGLDTRQIDTPLRTFRRFTAPAPGARDNVNGRALLKVSGLPAGERLRFAVLDWYDGEQWRPNPDRSPPDSRSRYLRLSSTIDNPSAGTRHSADVDVRRAWRSNWVPTVGALQSFEFSNFESSSRRSDLVYNPETRAALLAVTLRGVDDYEFSAKTPDESLSRDMRAAQGVDEDLYLRASYLDEIAQAYLARTDTPMQALFEAAAELKKRGRYSDGASEWENRRFPAGHGIDRLDQQFLHAQQMVGNDEQYAATMALLAIRLGIPARVVVGAVTPPGGVIRGKNVQAWIEVQLTDDSWRTLPTERFMSTRPPQRKLPQEQRLIPTWRPPPPAPDQPPKPKKAEEPPTKKKERKSEQPEQDSDLVWWILGLALVGLAIPTVKMVRRRVRRTRHRASTRIAGGWNELGDTARDLGSDWNPGLSRPREAQALGLPVALADRADLVIFAPADPTDEQVAAFWSDVSSARRELVRAAPWWRRLLAPVNPITLLRRRERDPD